MSKKIKGIFGSKERADEVLQWLIAQGAESASVKLLAGDTCNTIYYVNNRKQATWVNAIHSELFDIVELPRWRAKYEKRYYYVSDGGCVKTTIEDFMDEDDKRYECGNYFRTREEAEIVAKKISKIFKERR